MEEVWNENMMELLTISRAHTWYLFAEQFVKAVREVAQGVSGIREVLERLAVLLLIHRINNEMSGFLEAGYITPQQARLLRRHERNLCAALRQQDAIALVDAMGFSDFVLKSPLGRSDGDVYKHYFEAVINADGGVNTGGRTPYWATHIAPLTVSNNTKARL
jgi:acyl-CoA oxidase